MPYYLSVIDLATDSTLLFPLQSREKSRGRGSLNYRYGLFRKKGIRPSGSKSSDDKFKAFF